MGAFGRNPRPSEQDAAAQDVHTILGPESSFEGKLTFEGTVRIDGRFVGEVHTEHLLIVGPHARLKATLHVGSLILHGEIVGNIFARQWVEIHAPAKLMGDVRSPELMIDRGAVFQGASCMQEVGDGAAAPAEDSPNAPVTLLKSAEAGQRRS